MAVFSKAGEEDTIARKIKNILIREKAHLDPLEQSLLCSKCKTANVPGKTCKARINDGIIYIICLRCNTKINTKEAKKSIDKPVWMRSTYTVDGILEE